MDHPHSGDRSKNLPTAFGIRWQDMFILAIGVPGAVFTLAGYSFGAIGGIYTTLLWGFSAVIALLQNMLWARLAAHFPKRSGGLAMFAAEGWKARLPIVAPIAAFGYWITWSTASLVLVEVAAGFVVRQWFYGTAFEISLGPAHLDSGNLMAITLLIIFAVLNLRGVQAAIAFAKVSGLLLLIPIFLCLIAPLANPAWSLDTHSGLWQQKSLSIQDFRMLLAWLFTINFTVYATEMTTVFTPEYRSVGDMKKACLAVSLFSIVIFTLVPLGIAGLMDSAVIGEDPAGAFVVLFSKLLPIPYGADLIVVILVSNLLVAVNASIADAGRGLRSSAVEGLVPRQLEKLNKRGMPERAIILSTVINILLCITEASPVALMAAANISYMIAIVFGLSAYMIIRPHAASVRTGHIWFAVAAGLLLLNLLILVVGTLSFSLTGYGGWREVAIGITALSSSILLFGYRKRQNRKMPQIGN